MSETGRPNKKSPSSPEMCCRNPPKLEIYHWVFHTTWHRLNIGVSIWTSESLPGNSSLVLPPEATKVQILLCESCIMYYVLCTMYYVLCIMYYVIMYYVLCIMYYILYILYYIILYYIILYCIILYYIILSYIILYYIILYYIILYYTMFYHIILYCITSKYLDYIIIWSMVARRARTSPTTVTLKLWSRALHAPSPLVEFAQQRWTAKQVRDLQTLNFGKSTDDSENEPFGSWRFLWQSEGSREFL